MFKASAPGSLMLLGEYAVLHRQHALVCAIDKRMYVTLTPRTDKQVTIRSALGHHQTTLNDLQAVSPFQFILHALRVFSLQTGCDIRVESEFSATVGFASSAAVTVATLAALNKWLKLSLTEFELIRLARQVIRQVQGLGSGADVAACVSGGVILYRAQPLSIKKLSDKLPITVVYSGSKTPTVDAVHYVTKRFATRKKLFTQLMQAINSCVLEGASAVCQQDWQTLGEVMNIQQGLMAALGVDTVVLNDLIIKLRQQSGVCGAKISGSGLGDCVMALGECSVDAALDVRVTGEGVRCEEI